MNEKLDVVRLDLYKTPLEQICRVCLKGNKGLRALSKFSIEVEDQADELGFLEGFKKYFAFEVQIDDGKPHKICRFCVTQAKKSLLFSYKLHQSNKFLDKFLLDKNGDISPAAKTAKLQVRKDLEYDVKIEDWQKGFEEAKERYELEEDIKDILSDDPSNGNAISDNDAFENDDHIIVLNEADSNNDDSDINDVNFESEHEDNDFVPDRTRHKAKKANITNKKLRRRSKKSISTQDIKTEFGSQELFTCNICSYNTSDINEIIDHYKSDHLKEANCIICEQKNALKHAMLFHMSNHSKKAIRCVPCRTYFRTKELKEEHMKKYDHANPLVCHICKRKFTQRNKRDRHMKMHYRDKVYDCQECDQKFVYRTSYVLHYNRKHLKKGEEDKGISPMGASLCYICGMSFAISSHVVRHIKNVHDKKEGEAQSVPIGPKKQRKTPTRCVGEMECEFCGVILSSRMSYQIHRQTHPEFTDYPCKLCKAEFTSKQHLKDHQEAHHQKIECNHCGQRFIFQSQLKMHMVTHGDIKDDELRCTLCGFAGRTKQDIKNHVMVHTGEKPYICTVCGKAFRQRGHLTVHMYQHNGRKPNKCEVCGKAFSFKWYLDAHMRVHTGERPYSCQYCDKAFRDSTSLHKHKKKTHPVELQEELRTKVPGKTREGLALKNK